MCNKLVLIGRKLFHATSQTGLEEVVEHESVSIGAMFTEISLETFVKGEKVKKILENISYQQS